MAIPKRNDKKIPDPENDLDQDETTDLPERKKPADDDDDNFDEPFEDLEYDNLEDYEDDEDDF